MVAIAHNAKVNDLVIDLSHSLLQYAADTGVWSDSEASRQTLEKAAAQQRRDVGRLIDLLTERGWPIDSGTYPTDFTDLQFLSLEYLLPRIIEDQQGLVEELEEAVHTCIDDAAAVALLREALENERHIAAELRALSTKAVAAPATV